MHFAVEGCLVLLTFKNSACYIVTSEIKNFEYLTLVRQKQTTSLFLFVVVVVVFVVVDKFGG